MAPPTIEKTSVVVSIFYTVVFLAGRGDPSSGLLAWKRQMLTEGIGNGVLATVRNYCALFQ